MKLKIATALLLASMIPAVQAETPSCNKLSLAAEQAIDDRIHGLRLRDHIEQLEEKGVDLQEDHPEVFEVLVGAYELPMVDAFVMLEDYETLDMLKQRYADRVHTQCIRGW